MAKGGVRHPEQIHGATYARPPPQAMTYVQSKKKAGALRICKWLQPFIFSAIPRFIWASFEKSSYLGGKMGRWEDGRLEENPEVVGAFVVLDESTSTF